MEDQLQTLTAAVTAIQEQLQEMRSGAEGAGGPGGPRPAATSDRAPPGLKADLRNIGKPDLFY